MTDSLLGLLLLLLAVPVGTAYLISALSGLAAVARARKDTTGTNSRPVAHRASHTPQDVSADHTLSS